MGIKEIALRIGEEADEYADAKLQSKGEFHPDWHTIRDEYFAEALVESYKAELLKEVGEPELYGFEDGELVCAQDMVCMAHKTGQRVTPFYTPDQLAAAVLKATKPLEEEVERYKASPTVETCRQMIESQAVKENKILFDQLAKAEQLWQIAQGRCDGLEEKLAKAEQRVAKACIALIEDRLGELDGQDSEWAAGQVAAIGEISDGGWRKFVKEV